MQFPDELLKNSIMVCSRIKEKLSASNESYLVFILGDTSYGRYMKYRRIRERDEFKRKFLFLSLLCVYSCCVDIVAAEHCNADCVVHFGHSCLSFVDKLPVFYVFEKTSLDLDAIKTEVDTLYDKPDQAPTKIIVLYDVCYFYLYGKRSNRYLN